MSDQQCRECGETEFHKTSCLTGSGFKSSRVERADVDQPTEKHEFSIIAQTLESLCRVCNQPLSADVHQPSAVQPLCLNCSHPKLFHHLSSGVCGIAGCKCKSSAVQAPEQATPRPWKIYAYDKWQPIETYPKNIIESPTGESIAEIVGGWPQCTLAENEANAELIVLAVNNFEAQAVRIAELEDAATSALEWFAGFPHKGDASGFDVSTAAECYNRLEAALKPKEGK